MGPGRLAIQTEVVRGAFSPHTQTTGRSEQGARFAFGPFPILYFFSQALGLVPLGESGGEWSGEGGISLSHSSLLFTFFQAFGTLS